MSYRGGLGGSYNATTFDPGLQALQSNLVRVGLLPSSAMTGIWNEATETAVRAAASTLGYGVADAGCNTPGVPRKSTDPLCVIDKTTAGLFKVYADLQALIAAMPPLPPTVVATAMAHARRTPWLLIGGGVALVAAGAAAYFVLRKPKAVAANRRRRHRR